MTPIVREIVVYALCTVLGAMVVIGVVIMVFGWGRD